MTTRGTDGALAIESWVWTENLHHWLQILLPHLWCEDTNVFVADFAFSVYQEGFRYPVDTPIDSHIAFGIEGAGDVRVAELRQVT